MEELIRLIIIGFLLASAMLFPNVGSGAELPQVTPVPLSEKQLKKLCMELYDKKLAEILRKVKKK